MNILIVTSEWPRFNGDISGIHIFNQYRYLQQAGIKVDVFPFRGRKNPFAYWCTQRRFLELKARNYDLIHAHHGQSGIVALAQKTRPVVVTFHGSDLQGIRDRRGRVTPLGYLLRLSSQWVARRADEIILVAGHLAKYIGKRSYHLIPVGIDLNQFVPMHMSEARQALGLPTAMKLALFVGDPNRTEKRFWLAQKAVDLMQEPVQIVVANGVPPGEMPLYMNACNVLLVTSSTEGSPTTIKEALACNLPIVSTDVGDIYQRIGPVEGCLICENDEPEAIAFALRRVLERNKRILGREAVRDLQETILTKKVLGVYAQVLSRKQM